MRDSIRGALYGAIQESGEMDDQLQGAYCMGFIVIAEWSAVDGKRWLSSVAGGPNGDIPIWQSRGYLHDMLFDPPVGVVVEDDDEDDE